jgi:integration host factor subunit beta
LAIVKSKLLKQLSGSYPNFLKKDIEKFLNIILNEIKKTLKNGEDVRISGFAGFHLREKKARNARNPRSGEAVLIRARRVLTFKPSQQLLISTNRLTHESKDT